jgi:hypothetical protein
VYQFMGQRASTPNLIQRAAQPDALPVSQTPNARRQFTVSADFDVRPVFGCVLPRIPPHAAEQ